LSGKENSVSNYTDYKDSALLDALRLSNELAYRVIFDRHYKTLVGTAYNLLKDINSAKDITQDVFVWLWKNRESHNITSALLPYLKRATINRCLNLIKREARLNADEPDEGSMQDLGSPEETMAGLELRTKIDRALSELPERCRITFTLKRIEGYSVKEIAEQLDVSPKTVENQITKALKHLKLRLADYLKERGQSP
jgi:RNA polymerase sigma-70 factor (ECF subfamily)